jgi:hypothetical protein
MRDKFIDEFGMYLYYLPAPPHFEIEIKKLNLETNQFGFSLSKSEGVWADIHKWVICINIVEFKLKTSESKTCFLPLNQTFEIK